MKKILIINVFLFLFISVSLFAQNKKNPADNLIGLWMSSQKNGVIEIYKKGAKFYGKLAWIKDSLDQKTNLPKKDKENPDPTLRDQKILGLEILKGFYYVGENNYKEGNIYDPESGNTYSCKMKLSADGKTLDLRGYLGVSLLGRTEVWTRISNLPK